MMTDAIQAQKSLEALLAQHEALSAIWHKFRRRDEFDQQCKNERLGPLEIHD